MGLFDSLHLLPAALFSEYPTPSSGCSKTMSRKGMPGWVQVPQRPHCGAAGPSFSLLLLFPLLLSSSFLVLSPRLRSFLTPSLPPVLLCRTFPSHTFPGCTLALCPQPLCSQESWAGGSEAAQGAVGVWSVGACAMIRGLWVSVNV